MRILTVDNRPQALAQVSDLARELMPEAELLSSGSSLEALRTARKSEIDVAILRVETPELGGLDLGKYLLELNPLTNLIFVADKRRHGFEAMTIHASGYLLEPVEQAALKRELEDLRHPELEKKHKRVFAQTFGNFELFVDGKPVSFKYNRTKELVAVLVNNRGAQTTNGEIIANLWEDDGDPEKRPPISATSARICRTPSPACASTASSSSSAAASPLRPTASNAICTTGSKTVRTPNTTTWATI